MNALVILCIVATVLSLAAAVAAAMAVSSVRGDGRAREAELARQRDEALRELEAKKTEAKAAADSAERLRKAVVVVSDRKPEPKRGANYSQQCWMALQDKARRYLIDAGDNVSLALIVTDDKHLPTGGPEEAKDEGKV